MERHRVLGIRSRKLNKLVMLVIQLPHGSRKV